MRRCPRRLRWDIIDTRRLKLPVRPDTVSQDQFVVAHLRPDMIERLRTVHDKVGAPALFRLGGLLGDHVTACGFDGGFGLYGKWHIPLGLGR